MVRRIQGLCYKSGPKVGSGIRDSCWNQKPGSGSMIAAGSEESWDGTEVGGQMLELDAGQQ